MDNGLANAMKGTELLAERPDSQFTSTDLVCLNFKVPLRVRQQFKICAARHNLTMTELLLRLLNAGLTLDAQGQPNAHSQIKK
jgi:hypothetical protein